MFILKVKTLLSRPPSKTFAISSYKNVCMFYLIDMGHISK